MTAINCYSCTIPVFDIHAKTFTIASATYSQISYAAYNNNFKSLAPFMKITLRKPYSSTTETVSLTSLIVSQSYAGANGRFMDIQYEAYAGTTEPSTAQITVSSCQFLDTKVDLDGGVFRIAVDTILMSVSSTTFTSNYATGKGGAFYI
jgi:hypothetical protein